ncbi:hypothetical protein ACHMW6_24980 [Pseudoduganella sp. UC29_106]|uniref:hypothetical protein n=1 Tax=Pseudoduganella sp. UC29_106 TaxID=3374553 RepID=UPI0037568346
MKRILTALLLSGATITAALTGNLSRAHGSPQPNHGGIVQAVGETWLELVVRGDAVDLYVQDNGDDLPSAGMSGNFTVVNGAAKKEFALAPAGDNKLTGKAAGVAKGSKVLTVVTLADKKTKVSAAFDIK